MYILFQKMTLAVICFPKMLYWINTPVGGEGDQQIVTYTALQKFFTLTILYYRSYRFKKKSYHMPWHDICLKQLTSRIY